MQTRRLPPSFALSSFLPLWYATASLASFGTAAMLTEHTLTIGDASLHYARGPSAGPPLLFLHGVFRSWQDFVPLIPALAARWAVHALDFRGHGRSSRRPGAYRVVDYSEDAVAFLKHNCDEPAVVYGHS